MADKKSSNNTSKGSGNNNGNKSTPVQTVHRNSSNGQFVTESYANTHKATTEKQHIKR